MLSVPVEFVVVFQTFAPLFSPSIWPYAQQLLGGAILAPGKRTVSAVLRVLGLDHEPNFQRYHRVLNRTVWSALAGAKLLWLLLVATFEATGWLVFGLDETLERRWGQRIKARGIYRDAARSSKSVLNKTSGLRWLSVQLLTHIPWAGRIWALPCLTVLAPSERYYQKQGRTPKTLIDCARQAMTQIKRWLPKRVLIFVADSTYAAIELLAAAQQELEVTLITPLRLDAALYAPAPKYQKGQTGRPRVKGQALPKLSERLQSKKTRWQRIGVDWYGQGRRLVLIATGKAVWYHSGKPPVAIRWVLVRDPEGQFETRALLCTNPKLSARQIVELYSRRWQVEVTFEEVRAHLGVETQRQWSDKAIARTTPILLGLFSLVTVLAHRLFQRSSKGLKVRGAAWYEKPEVTFSDALACVRQRLWQGFWLSGKKGDRQKLSLQLLKHLAELLCYAQ